MTKDPQALPSLSVIIPCYNEDDNLPLVCRELQQVLPQFTRDFEVLIVDDGSRDQTYATAKKIAKTDSHFKVIHHRHNMGYGMALRSGFTHASHQWLFFTDGDRQFDIKQLATFLPYTQKYKIILGYRINRAEGQVRALNARLYKLFIDMLFRVHVKDIDCAFKLIQTSLVQAIPFRSTGAMVSAELLYRLKKQGLPFKQLPVTHYPRQYGAPTGANPKVILKAGYEAITLYVHMKFNLNL